MPKKQEIPLAEDHPLFKDADFGQALKEGYENILGNEEQDFDQLVNSLGLFTIIRNEQIPFYKVPGKDPFWTKERMALLIVLSFSERSSKIWTVDERKDWLRSKHGELWNEKHIKYMPIWNQESKKTTKGTWDQFNISWLILSEGKFAFAPNDATRMRCLHPGCMYGLTKKRTYSEVIRHRRYKHHEQSSLTIMEKFLYKIPFWRWWKGIEHDPNIHYPNGKKIRSNKRRELLEEMMNEIFLPFIDESRRLRLRDRVALGIDKTGLPEMIAGLVVGVTGTNYRGQSPPGHSGDLSDGTEVKSSKGRLYPNIDSILNVNVNGDKLEILPGEDKNWFRQIAPLFASLNSNARFVDERGDELIGLDAHWVISKSTSKFEGPNPYLMAVGGDGNKYGSDLKKISDGEHKVIIRQARSRANFGDMDLEKTRKVLSGRIVLCYLFHDKMGCLTLLVLEFRKGELPVDEIINNLWEIGEDSERPPSQETQWQPYLMNENKISFDHDRAPHNNLKHLNPRVLAFGRQTRTGFHIEHWDPKGKMKIKQLEGQILRKIKPIEAPNLRPNELVLDDSLITNDRLYFEHYIKEVILPYYRGMRKYTKMCHMSANIGFSTIGERMVCLLHGIQGTGSDARGGDATETDSSISEIKTATGEFGDFAGTIGGIFGQTYHLKEDVVKQSEWRRLFFNRIVDDWGKDNDGKDIGNLHIALLAPTQETMRQFHQNVWDYFSGTNSKSPDLQYPAVSFSDDIVHPYPHLNNALEFVRVAEFIELREQQFTYPNDIPEVMDCSCDYCVLGGFVWSPQYDKSVHKNRKNWRGIRKITTRD